MEKLNENQMEIIKKLQHTAYVIDKERFGISVPDTEYRELTGIDLHTLGILYNDTSVYAEVRYCTVEGKYQIQCETFIRDKAVEEFCVAFECDDFLGLFNLEKTVDELLEELFDNHFNEFENFLREKDYVKKAEITEDDVEDYDVKEDIAHTYIDNNAVSCAERAFNYMDSRERRDFIVDYLENNL